MNISGILSDEGTIIKHLNPIRYRRLKQICSRALGKYPKNSYFIVQIFYYKGKELHADVYVEEGKKINYFDTIYEISTLE